MDVLQLIVSGLANGCVYGLIAMGFVLIYKATEAVNFAQGDFMMLGAFICLGLTNAEFMGLPFWVSAPVAILIMGVFGYLLDLVVLRRMFGQSQIAIIILTIALGFVLRFFAGLIWGHQPVSLQSPIAGRDLRFGGLVLGLDELAVIAVTLILTIVLYFYFNRTRLGVAMQASSQNQLAAYYMGIPVKRMHSLVWALAGMVAAVAGILFASKGAIDPSVGLLGIKAFAAAVIGGFGSLPGALLGGLIVGLIEPFASRYIAAGYSQIMPYLLLFLILIFRPHGILAQIHRKKCEEDEVRIVFKTSYDADINLFNHRAQLGWYVLLLAFAVTLPLWMSGFAIGEMTNLLIWAVACMGLMVLVGQTGQPSLGHAAFLAVGCYANVLLQTSLGLPFILAFPLAGLIAGVTGMLIAMPMTRLHGVYLAIGTLAIAILADDFIVVATPLTNGVNGLFAPDISILGISFNRYANPNRLYYLILAITLLLVLIYRNMQRSPLGRSFAAVRDSEISAQAMGVNVARTKAIAFGISAGITGLGGALMGHFAGIFNNETFNIIISIQLLLAIVIGGLGTIHGAFFGAAVVALLPQAISMSRDFIGQIFGGGSVAIPGLEAALFGAILILFILFEPMGIYGRWVKIRTYFELFPFYRKDMFRRQKSYLKTERMR